MLTDTVTGKAGLNDAAVEQFLAASRKLADELVR